MEIKHDMPPACDPDVPEENVTWRDIIEGIGWLFYFAVTETFKRILGLGK